MNPGSSDQRCARFAGFLFLLVMAAFVAPMPMLAAVTTPGDFVRTARTVADAELLYRLALASQLLGGVAVILLAWVLWLLLRRVNAELALLALVFRAAEGALIAPNIAVKFAQLANYTGPADAATGAVLKGEYIASFNIYLIYWGVGSALFYYLMYRSRMVPRLLAAYAFAAVALSSVTVVAWGPLLYPERAESFPIWAWALMGGFEILLGLWLLIRGVDFRWWDSRTAPAALEAV